ncbi:hypothetical protein B0H13DRAFT_1915884 [Mycena leptocephala]|nr:hypothetical protein B0H13DRAFT_1915884 [Mycena leptocephala]
MAKNGCFAQYLNSAEGIPAWILVLSGIIGSVKSQQVIWALGTTIQLNGLKIQTRNGEKWVFYPHHYWCIVIPYFKSAGDIPAWIFVLSVIIVIWAPNSKIQVDSFKIRTRNGQKWLSYSVFKFYRGNPRSFVTGSFQSQNVIWPPRTKIQGDRLKIWARYGHNGCFTQYLNSVKGIPSWIWVLSIIIESQSNHMDSKSKLKTAKNGCFTQYLNSAGGISLWILVLRKVIWAPNSKIQADGFKIRTQNGQKWCFTQYLNSAKGIAAWILVLSGIIGSVNLSK